MTFFDGYRYSRVHLEQPMDSTSNTTIHYLGFTYTNAFTHSEGWCSLTYYIETYSAMPQNKILTRYFCKNYPEYFI